MRHALSTSLSTMLLAATMLLTGCVHKITRETVWQEIVTGKTTKQEVLDRFGAPYMKYRTPGLTVVSGPKEKQLHKPGEAWVYYVNCLGHYLGMFDGMEQETLNIQFDNRDIVYSYTFTSTTRAAPPK